MLTRSAASAARFRDELGELVLSRRQLYVGGCTAAELRARLDAGRWRAIGSAVVLHNGPLSRA